MPATSVQLTAARPTASCRAPSTLDKISAASCSTRPAAGKELARGRLAVARACNSPSNTTHRLDELPWSMASRTAELPGITGPGRAKHHADLAGDGRPAGEPALEDRSADGEAPGSGLVQRRYLRRARHRAGCDHRPARGVHHGPGQRRGSSGGMAVGQQVEAVNDVQ